MRRIRELLRYRFEQELSEDDVARAQGVSKGTVHNTLRRFSICGLSWPLPETLGDEELERRLFGTREAQGGAAPDIGRIEAELRRPHVTLELLWREYQQHYPYGMSRASFYRYVRRGLRAPVELKMIHKGGDKLFMDYSGDGIPYVDSATREARQASLFVASWGASSDTFADVTEDQGQTSVVRMLVAAFEWFECVPHALVPDNATSMVAKADRYEPRIGPLMDKLAEHYGVAVLPARVRKPRDKAVVESAVGFAQRYILGRLRDQHFTSLAQIRQAVRPLVEALNDEPMHCYGGQTRRQRFEALDKPHAQALPPERFQMCAAKLDVSVAPNYHVCFEQHFYSVPYHLARERVDIYQVGHLLEIYHKGLHVVRYEKQPPDYGYTTIDEHMPPHHRFVRGWSMEWFQRKAAQIGPRTEELVTCIMKRRRHPQQGFNSALGVLNLTRNYPAERIEAAAERALRFRSPSLGCVRSILERGLDRQPAEMAPVVDGPVVTHANVRGPAYYGDETSSQMTLALTIGGSALCISKPC